MFLQNNGLIRNRINCDNTNGYFDESFSFTIYYKTEFLNNRRSLILFKTFFFLKAYQNQCQAQKNNKEFMKLRQQQ